MGPDDNGDSAGRQAPPTHPAVNHPWTRRSESRGLENNSFSQGPWAPGSKQESPEGLLQQIRAGCDGSFGEKHPLVLTKEPTRESQGRGTSISHLLCTNFCSTCSASFFLIFLPFS